MTDRDQITARLLELRSGDSEAADRLYSAVYQQLRRLAHRQLLGERPGHTLGTTGLVHETYLKLANLSRVDWQDRGQFFRIASCAMRRILVDHARRHRAARLGSKNPLTFGADDIAVELRGDRLLALDEALDRLSAISERLGQVVECRFFGGLTETETAEALGVTVRTVQRDWTKARGWLYLELRD